MAAINGGHVSTVVVYALPMNEEWRPFRDGLYEASSHGNIRRAKPGIATFVGRPVKPVMGSTGYAQIGLSTGNGRQQLRTYVHRVVAEVFMGDCQPGFVVNHKNGDKLDNRLDNLEYVTAQQNAVHARRNLPRHVGPTKPRGPLRGPQRGAQHWSHRRPDLVARGERMGGSKLTAAIVIDIRTRVAAGPRGTQLKLAKEYNMSVAQVSRIVRRKRWAHV